jgi:hypothetical protein
MQHHILFSSLFIRETIAIILAVICIYFYFSARSSTKPVARVALAAICLIGTIFAHHLTSFMLIIFMIVHAIICSLFRMASNKQRNPISGLDTKPITTTFVIFALVSLFAYWVYVASKPMYNLLMLVKEIFNISYWGIGSYADVASIGADTIHTTRGVVIFYGFYLFIVIFGLILLYQLFKRNDKLPIETYSFTTYLFLCGFAGLLQMYILRFGIGVYPDRYLMYGWLFGFAPLAGAILYSKRIIFKRSGLILLVAFMIFNIYMIEPSTWNINAENIPDAPTKEDYSLANSLNLSSGKILDNKYARYAIYDVRNNLGDNVLQANDLYQYNWVIVNRKALELEQKYYPEPRTKALEQMIDLQNENLPSFQKIYNSNNNSVYKLKE